jgi:hypothetical protein
LPFWFIPLNAGALSPICNVDIPAKQWKNELDLKLVLTKRESQA